MTPELIRVDLPIPADTANTPAGAVAFIHFQKLENLGCPFRIFFAESHIQIGTIRMVVYS